MITKQLVLGVVALLSGLIMTGCAWYNGGYGFRYHNYDHGYYANPHNNYGHEWDEHHQGGHEWGEHGEQHYR